MKSISPQTLHDLLQQKDNLVLVDVRSEEEYQRLHVPGVILLPLRQIKAASLRELQNAEKHGVYVFCEHGYRARLAIDKLAQEGFDNAILVEGGTHAWASSGLPVLKGPNAHAFTWKGILALESLLLLLGIGLGYALHIGFLFAFAAVGIGLAAFQDWRFFSAASRSRAQGCQ